MLCGMLRPGRVNHKKGKALFFAIDPPRASQGPPLSLFFPKNKAGLVFCFWMPPRPAHGPPQSGADAPP